MTYLKNVLTLSVFLFCLIQNGLAQSSYDKGWASFNENNFSEAQRHFKTANKSPQTKSESLIMLSIIATEDEKHDEAYNYFQQFLEHEENPYPYIYALYYSASLTGGDDKDREDFLESLADDPDAEGTLRALAHSSLGYLDLSSGDFKRGKKHFGNVSAITDWQIVGAFENISGSGYNKSFGPLENPGKNARFTNKRNAEVQWFVPPHNRNDKWIDFASNFFTSNSIIYAQTFVKSDKEQDVQLRLGTSGSMKVWLNDELIMEEQEEYSNGIDNYIGEATLNRGNNRILIQIGASEVDGSNFMLRITDEKGTAIEGLETSTVHKPYRKAANSRTGMAGHFAKDFFKEKVAAEPDNLLNHILLAGCYLRNDQTFEARKLLSTANKKAPQNSYVRWKLCEVYAREGNRTELSKGLEWLKDNDKDNLGVMELLYNEALGQEKYDEAEDILDLMKERRGEEESYYEKRIELASKYDQQEEMLKYIEKGYDEFPENSTFVIYKYLVEKSVNKNNSKASRVLKKYLKKNYNKRVLELQAQHYFSMNNLEAGLNVYEDLIENQPHRTTIYMEMYDIYFTIQRYDMAMSYVDKALEMAPYVGSYWGKKGKVYDEQGEDSKAKEAYKTCIAYYPTAYDIRESLRLLEGKKNIFNHFEEEDVYEIYNNAPSAEAYPEDNSILLYDIVNSVVYGNGGSEEKYVQVVKMYNAQGVDEWKEMQIPLYGMQSLIIDKAEVLKPDGSKIAAEVTDNYIVFTGLEVNDGIHVTYKKQHYLTGKLANHFWDKMYFEHFYPSKTTRYSLLVAKGLDFQYKYLNGDLEPEVSEVDDFKMYVWEQSEKESIKHESFMPAITDVAEVLYISSFPDWEYISSWYSDLSKLKAKTDFEVKEVVASLFEEGNNLSQKEKVHEIYNYIVKNIRYSSISFRQSGLIPQKASTVLNTKIGDCKDVSTLFVAMCEEAGIEASLVLINTRNNGLNDLPLPSIDFNHCIAKVDLEGQPYYVELTSDYNPFSSFSSYLKNSFALEIYEEGNGASVAVAPMYLNPATKIRNEIDRYTSIAFEGNKVKITKENTRTGTFAASMRSTYRDLGKEAREKELKESITDEFPNLVLHSFKLSDHLNTTADSLLYSYSYEADDVFTSIGSMEIFQIPWAEAETTPSFLSVDDRKYPVEFGFYTSADRFREIVEIEIPAGKKMAELPQDVAYSCKVFDYSLTFKQNGNMLIATRTMDIKADRVDAADFAELKDNMSKIIKADKTQIAFTQ